MLHLPRTTERASRREHRQTAPAHTVRWAGLPQLPDLVCRSWSAAAAGFEAPRCHARVPSLLARDGFPTTRVIPTPRLQLGRPRRPRPAPCASLCRCRSLGSHGEQTWARQRRHQHQRQNSSPPVHPASASGARACCRTVQQGLPIQLPRGKAVCAPRALGEQTYKIARVS